MTGFFRCVWLASIFMVVTGCSSLGGGDPATDIIGRWRAEVAGIPVVVEYATSTVSVADGPAVGYTLEQDRLTFDGGGGQVRIVSFPSSTEMIQTDPLTGTRHHFRRL
jgi:hypothetical protein